MIKQVNGKVELLMKKVEEQNKEVKLLKKMDWLIEKFSGAPFQFVDEVKLIFRHFIKNLLKNIFFYNFKKDEEQGEEENELQELRSKIMESLMEEITKNMKKRV